MDKFIIQGPNELKGHVAVSGAKNAALPIIIGTLLYPGKVRFKKLPKLNDIQFCLKIVENLGAKIQLEGEDTIIDCSDIKSQVADYDIVRKMRASVLVLGPLLSRFHKGYVSLPGGCAIGARPVDIHLQGIAKLGATIDLQDGYIDAKAEKLIGSHILLPFPSVGATENIMMCAFYAEGKTLIENAAREPEIVDLAHFLKKLGCKIEGEGTSLITIYGVDKNKITGHDIIEYEVIPDRIEAATLMIAAIMTKSEIQIDNIIPAHLEAVITTLEKMGAKFEIKNRSIKVFKTDKIKATHVETAPYPGFPTDVQAQLMSLMCIADGTSSFTEHIFENRYMHVPELIRMGADINLKGSHAFINGVEQFKSAPVMCTDLRASAALVLAALSAKGKTEVSRIYHLDRGYEELEVKLQKLGAKIDRIKG